MRAEALPGKPTREGGAGGAGAATAGASVGSAVMVVKPPAGGEGGGSTWSGHFWDVLGALGAGPLLERLSATIKQAPIVKHSRELRVSGRP